MLKILKPDFVFEDERGGLIQLVHDGFKQFNVINSKQGAIRGGHYHKGNEELFFIIKGKVRLFLKYKEFQEEYIFEDNDMFLIEKEVIHDFEFLKDTLLVSMYNKGVELENGMKDIIKDE